MDERPPDDALGPPGTKLRRVREAVLAHYNREHRDTGMWRTNNRFIFYELEQVGLAAKPDPDDHRPNKRRQAGWPPGAQDVNDELLWLREHGYIPWDAIEDETRRLNDWAHAPSVAAYMRDRLEEATISPWGAEPPPLILCESRGMQGVLRSVASPYCCPIAGTAGQCHGFLRTVVARLFRGEDADRRVLYLGDLDLFGEDIEANSRAVLERCLGRPFGERWRRIGITQAQADADRLPPIWKVDGRRKGANRVASRHRAYEVEALGQAGVVALLEGELEALVPESLVSVQERAETERTDLERLLDA